MSSTHDACNSCLANMLSKYFSLHENNLIARNTVDLPLLFSPIKTVNPEPGLLSLGMLNEILKSSFLSFAAGKQRKFLMCISFTKGRPPKKGARENGDTLDRPHCVTYFTMCISNFLFAEKGAQRLPFLITVHRHISPIKRTNGFTSCRPCRRRNRPCRGSEPLAFLPEDP